MRAQALGMDLDGDLPNDWSVLEVLVTAKVVDNDGDAVLVQMCSPGLSAWEAAGMAMATADTLRRAVVDSFQGDDEDDEDDE
jgi:hypothetical protein